MLRSFTGLSGRIGAFDSGEEGFLLFMEMGGHVGCDLVEDYGYLFHLGMVSAVDLGYLMGIGGDLPGILLDIGMVYCDDIVAEKW